MRKLIEAEFRFLEANFGYIGFDYGVSNRRYVGSILSIETFLWDKYSNFDVHIIRNKSREKIDIKAIMLIKASEFVKKTERQWIDCDEQRIKDYSLALRDFGRKLLLGDCSEWEFFRSNYFSRLLEKRKWIAKFERMSPQEQERELLQMRRDKEEHLRDR